MPAVQAVGVGFHLLVFREFTYITRNLSESMQKFFPGRSAIAFTVLGDPVPQPRPRVTTKGKFARAYTPSSHPINGYRAAIAEAARQAGAKPVADMPLTIEIDFVFSRPKSHFNKKGLKPGVPVLPRADVTNCVKGVEDALNGIAYVDDRQLCSVTATKAWGEEALTRVRIS
jgi:Holliday junction resolvase RusA-like endonuclease